MIIYESLSLTFDGLSQRVIQSLKCHQCSLVFWLSRLASLFRTMSLSRLKGIVRSPVLYRVHSLRQCLRVSKLLLVRVGHIVGSFLSLGKSLSICRLCLQDPLTAAKLSTLCTLHLFSFHYYIKFFSHPSSLFPHPFIFSHPSSPIPHP